MKNNASKEELLAEIARLKKEIKKKKKYGLVWEDKPEDVVEQCKTELPVLKEVKNKEVVTDPNKPVNILIEGDNYHALSVLNYTHAKKVDVIYIDPPYNTGNKDFIYNDQYVDREDGYRHSKWLSFMEKRLKLAKTLLKETGVIFISIDDNEVAQLKMLCDKIFGEENLISNNIRITTKRVKGDSVDINKIHDYLLIYANKNHDIYHKAKKDYDIYEYEDKYLKERGKYLVRPLDNGSINYSEKSDYVIKAPNGEEIVAGGDFKAREARLRGDRSKKDWCFRWSEKKLKWGIENDFIVFKESRGKQRVYFKIYQFVDNELNQTQKYDNYLSIMDNHYNNKGTTELKNILKNSKLSYPKPLSLIKEIIIMVTKGDSIVLDFFAGSGTTGHAVLEMNEEDGGNRKFILCTNNENKICEEVTYPRLEKVINGYKQNGDGEKVEGLGGNLKYFKTSFVNAAPSDKNRKKLTEEAVEMLCVKEGAFEVVIDKPMYKLFKNHNHYCGIVLDQLAISDFKKAVKDIEGKCNAYIFSLTDESFDDVFTDFKSKVKISPIPETILRVYRRIFK